MPRFARLRATVVRDLRPGLQRMTLADNSEAYALTDLCGIVSAGDELLVNTTAVDLGLGTGGAHVVHANLTSPWLGAAGPGRIMKARYLSEQLGVETIEESGSAGTVGQLPSLGSVRVVLCVLHSHAVALAAAVADALGTGPGYVMTDGGALPFVLSDLAAAALEGGVIRDCGQRWSCVRRTDRVGDGGFGRGGTRTARHRSNRRRTGSRAPRQRQSSRFRSIGSRGPCRGAGSARSGHRGRRAGVIGGRAPSTSWRQPSCAHVGRALPVPDCGADAGAGARSPHLAGPCR